MRKYLKVQYYENVNADGALQRIITPSPKKYIDNNTFAFIFEGHIPIINTLQLFANLSVEWQTAATFGTISNDPWHIFDMFGRLPYRQHPLN